MNGYPKLKVTSMVAYERCPVEGHPAWNLYIPSTGQAFATIYWSAERKAYAADLSEMFSFSMEDFQGMADFIRKVSPATPVGPAEKLPEFTPPPVAGRKPSKKNRRAR